MASSTSTFRIAVEKTLTNWTALKAAVEHGQGGPNAREKVQWLNDVTEQFFNENDNLQPYEVEEYIGQIVNDEFDTLVEDNSLAEVSTSLCRLYKLCQTNGETAIAEISAIPAGNLNAWTWKSDKSNASEKLTERLANVSLSESSQESTSQRNLDDDDDDDEEDDGWTVVTSHKKR